jgi:aminopeptidase
MGAYQWSLKSKKDDEKPLTFAFSPLSNKISSEWKKGQIQAAAELEARTLANLPGNLLTPTTFCEKVKKMAVSAKMEVKEFDESEIVAMGMNGLIVVGKGSQEKIKLLQLIYRGNPDSEEFDLGYVGKGVTFDSGGISIKPSAAMGDMKVFFFFFFFSLFLLFG